MDAKRVDIDVELAGGLDRVAMDEGAVPPRHPFDIPERFVPRRDRLGAAAPL